MDDKRGFTSRKQQQQLCYEPTCRKDTKEGDKGTVIVTGDPTQVSFCLVSFGFGFALQRQTDFCVDSQPGIEQG